MKKVFGLLCGLLSILFIYNVNAAPSSVNVNQAGVMGGYLVQGEDANYWNWAKLSTSDGKVAYCIDIPKSWPSGDMMNKTDSVDGGLAYILENGYPNKKIVDGGDLDRYITQGAIRIYEGDTSFLGATDTTGQNIKEKMQALANAASSHTSSASNISVNANKNMTLSDGYYVSSTITPTVSGASTYNVSLEGAPSGATVTSTSGQAKNTFSAGEGFIVKVPSSSVGSSSTFNVKVSINGKSYVFAPTDSSIQRVIALYEDEVVKEAKTSLTITSNKVCVDYVIVGNVKPNPDVTDPTPLKSCYDKGIKYNQEKELTTKENCKFNGWFTKDDLTGKWVDGTNLNNDMTLYGAWECATVVKVPKTAAQTPLIILGASLISAASALGYYVFKNKKSVKVK